jgi:two-component system, sensor histidine kinase and response regulator
MTVATRKLLVWVVDDEVGMCRAAQRTLDDWEDDYPDLDTSVAYHVDVMYTGEEFIDRQASGRPDIVLLDGKLPGIGGFDVLEHLHGQKNAPVTVMITAYASYDKAVQATKLGAWDFLPKPFTPEELRNVIRKAARNVILTETTRKLEEDRRKLRFNFLSVLAHELKSPLDAIEGYIRIIQSRQAGNDLQDYDAMIERIGFRTAGMRKLIGDLLDLTRIEAGEGKREIQSLDLQAIAEAAIDLHKEAAVARGITLQVHIEKGLVLSGDNGEIEMLFNNLISNAIKYNRVNGSVSLHAERIGDRVKITCSDTGIGMTEEETGRLFKEFSRIKNASTRTIPGSGLGLTIVQKIVNRYHGTVKVESTSGTGTTFIVELFSD